MKKIVTKEEFRNEIRPQLKKGNKTIVLCHGVFDLIHPGHIIHFEQAKAMGDVLVVSLTAEQFVRKGPGRPYFNDDMRMKVLAAIESVDYVMLSEGYTVDDIIINVEPDLYVKGEEYAKAEDDITGKISEEQKLVEEHGGRVRFTTGQVFSSTKLINNALSGLPEEVKIYMEQFKQKYSMKDIIKYADAASKLKVLVLGDVIIDKYTYCSLQGLMSKDMGYSARQEHSEEYLGGAIAIARHLSSFSSDVTLMSIIGKEEPIRSRIFQELSDDMQLNLIYSEIFPTIVKHRYLTRNAKREEYRKIFAVNNIPDPMEYEGEIREQFRQNLQEVIGNYDVVFLCDFGHGLVDDDVIDVVQKEAKYLVLNCQTNSTNKGMNIITKYSRADVFTLDQREIRLAYPSYESNDEKKLKKLSRHLHGNGWLTKGSLGACGIDREMIHDCPAFTLSVKDTVGAGDAFLSTSGIIAAAGAPIEIGTFLGNIGGALGANIVGNKEAIEKVNVLKYASTLLNI